MKISSFAESFEGRGELGMHVSVEWWFLATLLLAQLYDRCAGPTFDVLYGPKKFGLWTAFFSAVAIAAASLALYKADWEKVIRMENPDIALALVGAAGAFVVAHLGVQYWSSHKLWRDYSFFLTALLVLCFFAKPKFASPTVFNNLLLMFCAIGIGCYVGHRVNRLFAYFFFTALFCFDIYAVWYSDIMVRMLERAPRVIPIGFIVMAFMRELGDFLGAGDVIFGVIGAIIIRSHSGTGLSLVASFMYVGSLWLLEFKPFLDILPVVWKSHLTLFPVMVTICPITIGCLLLGAFRGRSDSKVKP